MQSLNHISCSVLWNDKSTWGRFRLTLWLVLAETAFCTEFTCYQSPPEEWMYQVSVAYVCVFLPILNSFIQITLCRPNSYPIPQSHQFSWKWTAALYKHTRKSIAGLCTKELCKQWKGWECDHGHAGVW